MTRRGAASIADLMPTVRAGLEKPPELPLRSSPYGTCRYCEAEVIWAMMPDGMRPVDPKPTKDGNVVLWRKPDGSLHGTYLRLGDAAPKGTMPRDSHSRSCPRKR